MIIGLVLLVGILWWRRNSRDEINAPVLTNAQSNVSNGNTTSKNPPGEIATLGLSVTSKPSFQDFVFSPRPGDAAGAFYGCIQNACQGGGYVLKEKQHYREERYLLNEKTSAGRRLEARVLYDGSQVACMYFSEQLTAADEATGAAGCFTDSVTRLREMEGNGQIKK